MSEFFQVSPAWKATYPSASVGLLVMSNVKNPKRDSKLDLKKAAIEKQLKSRFAGMDRADLGQLPVLQAYRRYYKRFKKSYHVQLQLESIALKQKPIPSIAALVEAMFLAELNNHLLTAGHDLDHIEPPIELDVAMGNEVYTGLGGKVQELKAQDMLIRDALGIVSCIIYGPDYRTRIRPETRRVVFTTYAPSGITKSNVQAHMEDIKENVSLFSPSSHVDQMDIFTATE